MGGVHTLNKTQLETHRTPFDPPLGMYIRIQEWNCSISP